MRAKAPLEEDDMGRAPPAEKRAVHGEKAPPARARKGAAVEAHSGEAATDPVLATKVLRAVQKIAATTKDAPPRPARKRFP
jgi:hypothetical protein